MACFYFVHFPANFHSKSVSQQFLLHTKCVATLHLTSKFRKSNWGFCLIAVFITKAYSVSRIILYKRTHNKYDLNKSREHFTIIKINKEAMKPNIFIITVTTRYAPILLNVVVVVTGNPFIVAITKHRHLPFDHDNSTLVRYEQVAKKITIEMDAIHCSTLLFN